MLRLVEDVAAKIALQAELEDQLAKQLPWQGGRAVTFRPRSVELDLQGFGDGRLYFGALRLNNEQKFWNAFGILDESRRQQTITVEINISLGGGRTAGFFATDDGEQRFLMHTGGVGGGKKGVTRGQFLTVSRSKLSDVRDGRGAERQGILIGELGSPRLASDLEKFVLAVRQYKDALGS